MQVDLTASSISIDGQPLPARMNAAEFMAIAGPPVRSREIKMHPSGIRRVNVSASGIVWYVDEPEDGISHFHLAFSPLDTPEKPDDAFVGPILFGGIPLDAESTESKLRGQESIQLVGIHHRGWYDTTDHNVTLGFERPRNPSGKRLAKAHRLAYISISFHANDAEVIKAERQARRAASGEA